MTRCWIAVKGLNVLATRASHQANASGKRRWHVSNIPRCDHQSRALVPGLSVTTHLHVEWVYWEQYKTISSNAEWSWMSGSLTCCPKKQWFQYTSGMVKLTISNSTLTLTSQDMSSKACQSQNHNEEQHQQQRQRPSQKMKTTRDPKSFKNYPRAFLKEEGCTHTHTNKGIPRSQT